MDDNIVTYQRSRQRFALIVYLLTLLWLVLALIQWMVVNLLDSLSNCFKHSHWVSVIFFIVAILLTLVFVFYEEARFTVCVNWLLAILIVEFLIVGLFAMVAKSYWPELLLWFFICLVAMYIAILVSSVIPHDITLDVVILFVISFIFLVISVFLIMMVFVSKQGFYYIIYQVFVSAVILAFIMYHAQTINGGRFAEMRVNDFLLASIILFYDFIILFLLSCYVQLVFRIASMNDKKSGTHGNRTLHHG